MGLPFPISLPILFNHRVKTQKNRLIKKHRQNGMLIQNYQFYQNFNNITCTCSRKLESIKF